jgi:hypothetical protein
VNDIKLTVNPIITLGGSINVFYDGKPVPFVNVSVFGYVNGNLYTSRHDSINGHFYQPGYFAPWLLSLEGFDKNTDVILSVSDQPLDDDELLFNYFTKITVKDQSKTGIVLDLGEMKGTEWDQKR